MIGIYKITNPKGKIYIGQSINIEKRIGEYKKLRNCSGQTMIYRSLVKYGIENHFFEIIDECAIESLNERERYWQDYYDVLKNGLNCVLTRTDIQKKVVSKETKLKMSASMKGKYKGRKLSQKQIEFIKENNKGMTPPNKGKITIYHHNCNICGVDFETRLKTSKLCSLKCRDENNRIKNAQRKKIKPLKIEQQKNVWNKGVRLKPKEHGTLREYQYYKCRCEKCCLEAKRYYKQRRNKEQWKIKKSR